MPYELSWLMNTGEPRLSVCGQRVQCACGCVMRNTHPLRFTSVAMVDMELLAAVISAGNDRFGVVL